MSDSPRSAYLQEGIRLFQDGEYFLAHETLEEHWIDAPEPERDFYQGLIHIAVAFHHYRKGNRNGAKSQLFKAARRLKDYPDDYLGVNVAGLRSFLEKAPELLESGLPIEPPEFS